MSKIIFIGSLKQAPDFATKMGILPTDYVVVQCRTGLLQSGDNLVILLSDYKRVRGWRGLKKVLDEKPSLNVVDHEEYAKTAAM